MTEFLTSKNQQRAPWVLALAAGSVLLTGCSESGIDGEQENTCDEITVGQNVKDPMRVIVSVGNDDQIRGATYDFGDGKREVVERSSEYGTFANHDYREAGQFTISATVAFGPNNNISTDECPAEVVTVPYTG